MTWAPRGLVLGPGRRRVVAQRPGTAQRTVGCSEGTANRCGSHLPPDLVLHVVAPLSPHGVTTSVSTFEARANLTSEEKALTRAVTGGAITLEAVTDFVRLNLSAFIYSLSSLLWASQLRDFANHPFADSLTSSGNHAPIGRATE